MKKISLGVLLMCIFSFYSEKGYTQATFKVSGVVTDENGPVANVTVQETGTRNAVVTSASGTYSISVASGNSSLRFSHISYQPIVIAIDGRSKVDQQLTFISETLSDVVVTALGMTREKKALGYSVEEVSGNELNIVPHENVLTGLSGKVSGVTINQTGDAGSSVSMVIRGATSLNNDNQPLFVVDGVPINNSLNNVSAIGSGNRVDFGNSLASINPDDIASVTILKGPSAAALYGSRAGNGVVIITTKSGANVEKLTVSASSNTVFDIPYKYLDWQTKYGAGLFPAIPVEQSGNLLTNPFNALIQEEEIGTFGGLLDMGYEEVQWNSSLDENGKPIKMPLVSHPDNAKNFVQTGITTINSVSIANSSDKMNYRVSYSNLSNRGLIPHSDLFRNTLDISSALHLNKNVRLSTNINISRNNSNNRPAGGGGANPLAAVYRLSPHIDVLDMRDYWMPGQEGIQQRSSAIGVFNNPYFLAAEVKNGFVRDRIYGNVKLDWQITKGWDMMVRYSLDTYNETRRMKVPYSYVSEPRGAFGIIMLKPFQGNADFLTTYKKRINDFDLSVSAGGNIRRETSFSTTTGTKSGTGLVIPNLYTIQNILPESLDFSSRESKKGVNSLYGLVSLGVKDMAYLDITGRNDWSSTLPGGKGYFYPSASLSLLANQLLHMTSSTINLIKLRGGVAQVGNDTDPYRLYQTLNTDPAWDGSPQLSTSSVLLNPDLKPERATSYEGGLDFNLFKNRLRFSGTYYRLDNRNQIFTTELPPSSGYPTKNINAGLLRSKGWELSLGGTPVESHNLIWDINVNFTRNRTWIMELSPEMQFFTFWTEGSGGAWSFAGEQVGDIYDAGLRVVEDKSSPYNGYPILSLRDGAAMWSFTNAMTARNKIGNFNPDFVMGVQSSLRWKNLTLDFTIDWRNGGDFISETYYNDGITNGRSKMLTDQFIDPGQLEGKELRDYLVAHADELIKVNGNFYPRIGWPTREYTSYPFTLSGFNIPFDGVFIPGVYEKFDDDGNLIGYVENLGENLLGKDPNNPNATYTIPFAAATTDGIISGGLFPASYIKLRQISITYNLTGRILESLKLSDASISVFSRNIILWTKAKINIDPERAYLPSSGQAGGVPFKQGIELYNVTPWTLPIGVKLGITF